MERKLVLLLILAALGLYSCSDSISKPSYTFKKPVGDGVVAKIGDITITEKELVEGIETDIYEQEQKMFDLKFDRIKMLAIEKLMEKDPKKKGLTNDEYMDKYISSKVTISDKEIADFVKEKKIPEQQMNEQFKERIKQYLLSQKKVEALDDWLAEKTKKDSIEVFLMEPTRPTFEVEVGSAPFAGGKDAKVTIVEFSDFQCPFCSKGAETVSELKKKYGDKIKIAFKNYPLPFHKDAKGAAVASLCAHEQGANYFWKLHDYMFANQQALKPEELKAAVKKLGMDDKKFSECLDGNKYLAAVNQDIDQGRDLGVKSTPTFYVNGMLLQGAQPIEEFAKLIDKELNK